MVVHACPHTTWEDEAGEAGEAGEAREAGVQEFEVILHRIAYRV